MVAISPKDVCDWQPRLQRSHDANLRKETTTFACYLIGNNARSEAGPLSPMSEFSSTPKSALMLTFSYTARGRGRFFVSSFRHTRDRRKKSCRTELSGLTNCTQIGSPSGGRNSNYKWLVCGGSFTTVCLSSAPSPPLSLS